MDMQRLTELAGQFHQTMETSQDYKDHMTEHRRRSQRAQAMLTPARIPALTEDDLRELFFDSDAFSFWSNKEWEFNHRLQNVGLEGLRQALLELITRAERGLSAQDLKHVWDMGGLGMVLSCELIAYRFPARYWPYSERMTLPAFKILGDDIKANNPLGQRSSAYLYLALESRMAEIRQALTRTGFQEVDNLTADLFLWWVKKNAPEVEEPETSVGGIRYWKISPGTGVAYWDEFREQSVIAIGWAGGDLRKAAPGSQDELKAFLEKATPMRGKELDNAVAQMWLFYGEMQEGDLVCAYGHRQILAWGEVTGPYTFTHDKWEYEHRRAVRWISTDAQSISNLSPELQQKIQVVRTIVPLTRDEFVQIQALSRPKQAWIFQANPAIYNLEEGLRDEWITDWQVRRYRSEVHRDDYAVLWKSGEKRGIYGLGTVNSDLYQRQDGEWVVDVKYEGRLRTPILYEDLREHPVLSQMLIMRQYQGTNFRITAEEWAALEPLLHDVIPPKRGARDARGKYEPGKPQLSLLPLLQRLFANSRLHFTSWQIATFYTALQTKGFVILSGISGTGKTKLAQHFAELLPQPAGEPIVPEDQITITVQPYMAKYSRLIIPKQATRLFDPPPPGESRQVTLKFDGQSQSCLLTHASYGTTDYISLAFRGKARTWFKQTFAQGDTLILEPEFDHQDQLAGFRLNTAASPVQEARPATSRQEGKNWLFVSVRPDWRDSKSLLGYYNPLTGTYEWTPFLRFLLQAAQSYRSADGLAWFLILDEMNLAHVEYYFADMLSVLESGRDEDGWTREPLRLVFPEDAEGDLPPREVYLPPSLYIVGTVNVDETTHAFSPKVLDRAFTIELTEANFTNYPPAVANLSDELDEASRARVQDDFTLDGNFVSIDKQAVAQYIQVHPELRDRLQTLNELLQPYELHFGYRVFDEVVSFLGAAEHNGLYADEGGQEGAFDAAVLMKILPKFHGSRGKLETPLCGVLAWCIDPDAPAEAAIADALKEGERGNGPADVLARITYRYPRTARRVIRMMRALYASGFAAFG